VIVNELLVRPLSLFVTVTFAEEVGLTYPTDSVIEICELLDVWPEDVTPGGRLTVGDVPKPDPEIVTSTSSLPTYILEGETLVIVGFCVIFAGACPS
jgi:hypothetical protein